MRIFELLPDRPTTNRVCCAVTRPSGPVLLASLFLLPSSLALGDRLTSRLPTSAYVSSPTIVFRLATDDRYTPRLRQSFNAITKPPLVFA